VFHHKRKCVLHAYKLSSSQEKCIFPRNLMGGEWFSTLQLGSWLPDSVAIVFS
jgi:hypothetical protein